MSEYLMTSKKGNDCGPKMLAYLTQRTDAEIEAAMGILDIEKFSNFCDSPWHHFAALEKLQIPYRVITLGELLSWPEGKPIKLFGG